MIVPMASKANKRTRMSASERREQLIDVARRLFAEKGFEGTSIEEIASRAKVSKPVVYEHLATEQTKLEERGLARCLMYSLPRGCVVR